MSERYEHPRSSASRNRNTAPRSGRSNAAGRSTGTRSGGSNATGRSTAPRSGRSNAAGRSTAPRSGGSNAAGRSTGTRNSRAVNRRKYIIRQRMALLVCTVLLCGGVGFAAYRLTRGNSPEMPPVSTSAVSPTDSPTEPVTQPAETEPVRTTEPPADQRGELPRKESLPVDALLQNPELPSGCEITALTCVLNYLGFDVSKTDMVKHLNITPNGGVSYYEYFVGSPYDPNSFGCFAPVIVKAAQSYLTSVGKGADYTVSDLSGSDPSELYWQVAEGNPVVVWATMNMREPIERVYWNLPDGTPEMWYTYEHCMVLSGYDMDTKKVEICDPQKGKVQYDMETFETRYKQLQSQAVTVVPEQGAVPVNGDVTTGEAG